MQIANPLRPYGAVPSPRQEAWHAHEFYGFLHFTVNTFSDREWGLGNESPDIFNPSDFSATQIVDTARRGGMQGLILTAKHHDGFCLWPSQYTTHSVKNSPWRDGQGDVVAELAQACAVAGLKFGIYLSPWDRNHPDYGTPAYLTYYRNQLRELLSNYGPLFEVWFDGANGGDGYYGGSYEKRSIDNTSYYEWDETFALVRELQPHACIFSDAGPDVRWVGNEQGIAGDPCWHTIDPTGLYPGNADPALLNVGQRHGSAWLPAECDVSIRPGWFYHQHEDDKVRSPENLRELYFASVGRGANLLVNLPVTPVGQVHAQDRINLLAFHALRQQIFATNLIPQAQLSTSSAYENYTLNGATGTFWMPEPLDTTPWIMAQFATPVAVNLVDLREHLPLGQRIDRVAIDVKTATGWREVAHVAAVGNRRLIPFERITTTAVRIRMVAPVAPAALRALALYDDTTSA
jgi:alpha-L-fucosidase